MGILEHPNYGLIKLAKEGHPATKKEGIAEEIFRTGLRAYIGSLADGADGPSAIASGEFNL